jgi:hypothetical protein
VVSELPNGRGDESAVDINLIDGANHTPLHLDIVQPEGVKHPFANFAAEVTHKQFLGGIGHAIIHSKVVVIDPFSADPVVITGTTIFRLVRVARTTKTSSSLRATANLLKLML